MKFKKEELSEAIKAKLTVNGKSISMSERTLSEMVNNHYALATEETELADFTTKILPFYESVEGQLRHDFSEYTKKWEQEHPIDTPKNTGGAGQQGADDATAKLLARVEALEKERAEQKTAEILAEKKSAFLAKAKEKGIGNNEWLSNYASTLAINAESDVEEMAENALTLFNLGNADVSPNLTPGGAGGGTNNDDKAVEEIAARLKARNNF